MEIMQKKNEGPAENQYRQTNIQQDNQNRNNTEQMRDELEKTIKMEMQGQMVEMRFKQLESQMQWHQNDSRWNIHGIGQCHQNDPRQFNPGQGQLYQNDHKQYNPVHRQFHQNDPRQFNLGQSQSHQNDHLHRQYYPGQGQVNQNDQRQYNPRQGQCHQNDQRQNNPGHGQFHQNGHRQYNPGQGQFHQNDQRPSYLGQGQFHQNDQRQYNPGQGQFHQNGHRQYNPGQGQFHQNDQRPSNLGQGQFHQNDQMQYNPGQDELHQNDQRQYNPGKGQFHLKGHRGYHPGQSKPQQDQLHRKWSTLYNPGIANNIKLTWKPGLILELCPSNYLMGLQNRPQPPAYQQTSYHHNHNKVINEIHENKENNKETLDYITELNTQRQEQNQVRALIKDKQNEEIDVKLAQAIDRLATPEYSIYEEQNVITKENPSTMEYNPQGQEENTISMDAKIRNSEKATTVPDKEKIVTSNGHTPNNILSNQHTA
ncbi:unnamed protein product [Mytilus coruscus]|uniref:Uncharacterized protein n=1 Tax=Mytilus coruscus TaxID=42192 RepID=A0A6J8EZ81_MYTCO|nr:unnamed protein product [Mytilus coruscus]